MKNLYHYRAERVASRYMEARLFGLLSNHIGWQDLKRFQKQLQWMFKKGQHQVSSSVDRLGNKTIRVEALGSCVEVKGFKGEGSGFSYKRLSIEVGGRLVKRTEDLDEVQDFILSHFRGMGLR